MDIQMRTKSREEQIMAKHVDQMIFFSNMKNTSCGMLISCVSGTSTRIKSLKAIGLHGLI